MSHVDERIRSELGRLSVPVETRHAFERVAIRRRRLRAVRRVRMGAILIAVIVGTVGGIVGLRSLMAPADRSRFGGLGPSSTPSPTVKPARLCGVSSETADLDGDGVVDHISVGIPLPASAAGCRDVSLDGSVPWTYVARLELGVGTDHAGSYEQPLPECEVPGQCWILGAPDLDRDGRAEIAIDIVTGVSTLNFSLYRVDAEAPDGPLHRLEIAAPGDPFDELYGFPPGSSSFSWYGSVTHQHWVSCAEGPGEFAVVTALRDERDPGLQDVHTTVLAIQGYALVVASTRDEALPDGSAQPPSDLCGVPLAPRP
jgi:hypothetical protein